LSISFDHQQLHNLSNGKRYTRISTLDQANHIRISRQLTSSQEGAIDTDKQLRLPPKSIENTKARRHIWPDNEKKFSIGQQLQLFKRQISTIQRQNTNKTLVN
jgi:hypothetical protein